MAPDTPCGSRGDGIGNFPMNLFAPGRVLSAGTVQGTERRAMTQAATDLELLRRIAAKDAMAVQTLFARHHVRLFRFLVRMVRNEAIAEELTNEVFIDVWRNAGSFEGRSAPSTWLLSIARNKAISTMRRRRDDPLDDQMAAEIPDSGDNPEEIAQKRDKSTIIRACLEHLSTEHKEVIDLVYYHEKSVKEVSEIVGIPENTVKTRMFYARKALSELLANAGIDRGWP
jgi:RNA polymerase sigma-70 factor (ECF subfamily)